MPRPRKLKTASNRIDEPIFSVMATITGDSTLGNISLTIIMKSLAPLVFADSTNSRSLTERMAP